MRQLDFRPNAIARSLASRRSRILALTFPASENRFGNTIMEFVSSAAAAARDSGYHLVVWPYAVDQADEMCDMSQQGLADGVIVMEVRVDDPRIKALSAAQVPFTLIGRGRPDTDNRSVDIDFDATAEAAVGHLTDLGHRHIGFLNHSESSRLHGYGPTVRAQDAYRAAMARRGLTPFTRYCDENPLAGRAAMKAMREQNPDLTALVAMNEDALFGVVAELHRQGVVVPDDFSLVSMLSVPPGRRDGRPGHDDPALARRRTRSLGGAAPAAPTRRLRRDRRTRPHPRSARTRRQHRAGPQAALLTITIRRAPGHPRHPD